MVILVTGVPNAPGNPGLQLQTARCSHVVFPPPTNSHIGPWTREPKNTKCSPFHDPNSLPNKPAWMPNCLCIFAQFAHAQPPSNPHCPKPKSLPYGNVPRLWQCFHRGTVQPNQLTASCKTTVRNINLSDEQQPLVNHSRWKPKECFE